MFIIYIHVLDGRCFGAVLNTWRCKSGTIHTFMNVIQLRHHIFSSLIKDILFPLYYYYYRENHANKTETSSSQVQNNLLHLKERKVCASFIPSILGCFFKVLSVVTMTQTCHDALDPNRATRQSKYFQSPGGNRPSAVFSIHHTITKWIFDLDWYSHFLSPATPWRTKQFSCYPWTVRTTLNSTPQHLTEHKRPAGSQLSLVRSWRRKVDSKAK